MLTYIALFLLFMGQPEPPNGPATKPEPDYPVQVRILESRWTRSLGTYTGFGRADILGPDPHGIDFTYECNQPFRYNAMHGEFYQAKWKKQDLQLELVVQKTGSDHISHCTLKTTLKPAAFSSKSVDWLKPLPAPADPGTTPPAKPATSPPAR